MYRRQYTQLFLDSGKPVENGKHSLTHLPGGARLPVPVWAAKMCGNMSDEEHCRGPAPLPAAQKLVPAPGEEAPHHMPILGRAQSGACQQVRLASTQFLPEAERMVAVVPPPRTLSTQGLFLVLRRTAGTAKSGCSLKSNDLTRLA